MHTPLGGVRFEVGDLIQFAWMECFHWANVPEAICCRFREIMDYRQNHHREGDKSSISISADRDNSRAHGYTAL